MELIPIDVVPLAARRAAAGDLLRGGAGALGALAVLVALAVIWAVRTTLPRTLYVSELGSPSLPTADAFNSALLLLGIGAALAGIGCLGAPRAVGLLGLGTVSASLITAGVAFGIASQLTCTPGCPVPLTAGSTPQDLLHTGAAVVGFGAGTWAMLQVSWSDPRRRLRVWSRCAAVAVGLIASLGGILSVLQYRTDIGGTLEFVAMSIAVLWLVAYSASTVRRRPTAIGPAAVGSAAVSPARSARG